METLIIALLVAYNIWIVSYLLMEKKGKGSISEKDKRPNEKSPPQDDGIMGKSKFKMPKSVPNAANLTPLEAKQEKGEDIPEMPATFALETEVKPSARVADDKMDDVFSDTRMDKLPHEYNDEEGYDGTPNDEFATGGTFDEIGESVETANNPNATPEEEHKAGKIFTELEGTNLFEKIVTEYPERKSRIMELMDNLYKTKKDIEKPKIVKKEFKMPTTEEEFNIRDYV